ncbi:hypothetical protein [Antarcticirhabdus aurantiaca]|uniref:Uncharacterized protein n=1 Tax=Antarcticirhabdus aurantiaca TaxID=2606717 RepID=A0ACD4NKI6_9HYPH|nr:hypothetical protein [Antarcticirhabdus aurantiaca]WAJ27408.1 hypothetical protein OXU80_21560 [Jeongeuplla avenae]
MTKPTEHVFSRNSAAEKLRVPKDGLTPRVSDTLVGAPGSPDPDYHPEAQANALTDTEAGTIPDNDEGGIVPLKRRQ